MSQQDFRSAPQSPIAAPHRAGLPVAMGRKSICPGMVERWLRIYVACRHAGEDASGYETVGPTQRTHRNQSRRGRCSPRDRLQGGKTAHKTAPTRRRSCLWCLCWTAKPSSYILWSSRCTRRRRNCSIAGAKVGGGFYVGAGGKVDAHAAKRTVRVVPAPRPTASRIPSLFPSPDFRKIGPSLSRPLPIRIVEKRRITRATFRQAAAYDLPGKLPPKNNNP